MRESAQVFVAVATTKLALWVCGVRSWANFYLGKWPWLLDRYIWSFPFLLAIVLLLTRRWRPMRSSFAIAGLVGFGAGLVTSMLTLILVQTVTATERAVLFNGLRLQGGPAAFLFFSGGLAFFFSLSWLSGSLASMLAIGLSRLGRQADRFGPAAEARPD